MEENSKYFTENSITMEKSKDEIKPLEINADTLLTSWKDYFNEQLKLNHDNKNVLEILPDILKLQNGKEKVYGRSWCKHGDLSAFFNLERKWDRIQNIMEHVMVEGQEKMFTADSSTPTETVLDTIIDLGCYSLMWAGYIKERHPELWEQFKTQNNL